jgi:hypothetical protein
VTLVVILSLGVVVAPLNYFGERLQMPAPRDFGKPLAMNARSISRLGQLASRRPVAAMLFLRCFVLFFRSLRLGPNRTAFNA